MGKGGERGDKRARGEGMERRERAGEKEGRRRNEKGRGGISPLRMKILATAVAAQDTG